MSNVSSRLEARGIGKRYHDKALAEGSDKAKQMLNDLKDNELHFQMGNGANFYATDSDGYDIVILSARALILGNTLPKLTVIPYNTALDAEVVQTLWDEPRAILLTNFYPDSPSTPAEKYSRLESLLDHYLDASIPIILHFPNLEKYGNLVSPVFLDRVRKINKSFRI